MSEPINFADICYQLHSRDSKLAKVIDSVGACDLFRCHAGFEFLVDAIIGQQLSKGTADTITKRFRNLFASGQPTPKQMLSLPMQNVLNSGISLRKYGYIIDLAQKIARKWGPYRSIASWYLYKHGNTRA